MKTGRLLSILAAVSFSILSVLAPQGVFGGGLTISGDNVGIGTTTPSIPLEVVGTSIAVNAFSSGDTIVGKSTGTFTSGVAGQANNGYGVYGYSSDSTGVKAYGGSYGIYAESPILAGYFLGNVEASGVIAAGSFTGSASGLTGTAGINITGNAATATTANSVVSGGVTNGMLQNPSLTVSAGTGLSGGGVVSLGGSTTLNVNFGGTGSASTAAKSDHDHSDADYNTKVGINALTSNTTGTRNTTSGVASLSSNTTGSYNAASGAYSLSINTTGSYNTASGAYSLTYNTTGDFNVADGYASLSSNTTASRNTAIGADALFSQSYDNGGTAWDSLNTAVGSGALYSNQPTSIYDGMRNTAVGSMSLYANTTGFYNAASGAYSLSSNTTGSYNAASGAYSLSSNTTGSYNTASGDSSLNNNTTGYQNTALGDYSGFANTTGFRNTFIGSSANAALTNLSNATAIGYDAVVDASNQVRIGNSAVEWIGGQVAWSFPSDIRKKKDIQDIDLGLDFIKSLRPVKFRMIQGNDRIDLGFIAQDIEALLGTEYNVLGIGEDADHTLSLRSSDFIAPMVKAMQEQQEIIEEQAEMIGTQEEEIESQKVQIKSLEERLSRLEALLSGK